MKEEKNGIDYNRELIDSSVWMDYFVLGNFKEIIEIEKELYLSVISMFEIKTKLIKKKINKDKIKEKIDFIKAKSIIIDLDNETAETAAEIAAEKDLPMADALIYSSAFVNNLKLITLDNDFRGLDNAIVLDKK